MDVVNGLMVWGSLLASAILGGFLLVQAHFHKNYRARYVTFALICFGIAGFDFLRVYLSSVAYETWRVFAWSFYGAGIYLVFSGKWLRAILLAVAVQSIGWVVWAFVNKQLATTVVVPLSFYIASFIHIRQYWRNHAFGSCILGTYSLMQGLLCTSYYITVMNQVPLLLSLGYAHYLSLMVISVLFGWINIPREMEGQIPVRVERKHALWHGGAILLIEAGIIFLLTIKTVHLQVFLALALLLLLASSILYFFQRHNLVIYTNDIAGLLDERTTDLRQAESQLREINSRQATRIEQQDLDIQNKQLIIDRQSRLELAAQAAGQAAHDIQNLISPLLTHLTILSQHANDAGQVKKSSGHMREAVEHLLEANAQMLASSRRGRIEMGPLPIEDVIFSLRQLFPDLTIEESIQGCWVNGSYAQLHRAVANLAKNAFDAVQKQGHVGKVTLYADVQDVGQRQDCHLGFLEPGSYIRIQVIDNGPGIPPEAWDHMFEPFYSSKASMGGSGTGLGLSIVQGIIKDHNGIIDVSSDEKGTCFSLYLPQGKAPDQESEPQLSPGTTVLVVDDDSMMRSHLVQVLEQAGATVHQASGAKSALKLIARYDIHCLLLDIRLRQSSGTQVYFDALHLKPALKAVVHSSYIAEPERQHFSALGVTHLLTKPASPRQLTLAIQETLNS